MSENQEQEIGFLIKHHYLNDLSIENPLGTVAQEEAHALRLGMDGGVKVNPLAEANSFQVAITLRLTAALGERVVFLAELTYRVDVELHGIPEPVRPHVLCVEVPTAIFPVIQEILTRNGAYAGYPDLQVAPLDFREIFNRNESMKPAGVL
ncbi:MAG: protein-export chaperone SecB [Sulfurimicrobium sp.]|nr:protein-export chaperone SecB [Sulfurimicrobium sp.]